jgi:phospholipase C
MSDGRAGTPVGTAQSMAWNTVTSMREDPVMLRLFGAATAALLVIGTGPVGLAADQAPAAHFKHVIVIVQENRTPDNLFQGLCAPPYGSPDSCDAKASAERYDIAQHDWNNKGVSVQPGTVALANNYDLNHSHAGFLAMCDPLVGPGATTCRMDGAAGVKCRPRANCQEPLPQFKYVDNSTGIVNPYLDLATQYGWANLMFQTNQGPSFPAHQFLFGGTSAPSAADDAAGVFASENMTKSGGFGGSGIIAGCTAKETTTVALISPAGENQFVYPCFDHETMGDLFAPPLTWRYYTPSPGSIWAAPNAIKHICMSSGYEGHCMGPQWRRHLDFKKTGILDDIGACKLRSVSWVIPTGQNSDHANDSDGGGPSWVASIVNAVGTSTGCDDAGYWKDTAIFLTWDDWGGWYDHEAPPILAGPQGDYQIGFRVPLIVISAYTPKHLINNTPHDFGSILRFIEGNFGIQEGVLGFADRRAHTDLSGFFHFAGTEPPRSFAPISASRNAAFFHHDKRAPTDPDDE